MQEQLRLRSWLMEDGRTPSRSSVTSYELTRRLLTECVNGGTSVSRNGRSERLILQRMTFERSYTMAAPKRVNGVLDEEG